MGLKITSLAFVEMCPTYQMILLTNQ